MGRKHLFVIFGAISSFLLITGIGYYVGYAATWEQFLRQPKIGAEPLDIKIVCVVKDIAPGQEIAVDSIDERHETRLNVALDAYSFSSDVLGRKLKWTLHKGDYISRHDLEPRSPESPKSPAAGKNDG